MMLRAKKSKTDQQTHQKRLFALVVDQASDEKNYRVSP